MQRHNVTYSSIEKKVKINNFTETSRETAVHPYSGNNSLMDPVLHPVVQKPVDLNVEVESEEQGFLNETISYLCFDREVLTN